MPYRNSCLPPVPPIVPVDASEDIKLKILESKVVPKAANELKEAESFDNLTSSDFVYVTTNDGDVRKLQVPKVKGKAGLICSSIYVITLDKNININNYSPVDRHFNLGADDVKYFNRLPEQNENFNLYINVRGYVDPSYEEEYRIWVTNAVVEELIFKETDERKLIGAKIYINQGGIVGAPITFTPAEQEVLENGVVAIEEAPTEPNVGRLRIVQLAEEPAEFFDGYLYIIDNDEDNNEDPIDEPVIPDEPNPGEIVIEG